MKKPGSLTVVGTGIKLGAHITLETLEAIRRADHVFFIVTEPATEAWIQELNPASESLQELYVEGKSRHETYLEMAGRICDAVRSGRRICAAFYGHPAVFVDATHRAIYQLRAEGYPAIMLPGVSAEDCLFADLGVNPGDHGSQTFEATDFLAARRRFDPTSDLILFQAGVLGERSVRKGMKSRPERLQVLADTLMRHYPKRHPVFIYEASSFPTFGSTVKKVTLTSLSKQTVPPMATLYLPPLPQRRLLKAITRWYDEG